MKSCSIFEERIQSLTINGFYGNMRKIN